MLNPSEPIAAIAVDYLQVVLRDVSLSTRTLDTGTLLT